MNSRDIFVLVVPSVATIGLLSVSTGCVSRRVDFNPSYLPKATAPAARIQGKALLLAEPAVYDYVYSGRPNSFHGGGTTLELPLGKVVRDDGEKDAESAAAPADSARKRLADLKKLYDDGLISKESYEQKQKEILKHY